MPYDTLEVRWFFEAASLPNEPEVETWFRSRALAEPATSAAKPDHPPDWRTDLYLIVPGTDVLAIKLREGRFEVKGKVSDFGAERFAPDASGRIERWMKWSAEVPPAGRWLIRAGRDDGVVPVTKQRLLKTLRIDRTGCVMDPASAEPGGASDFDFELTRIRLGNGERPTYWTTLGFEAPYRPSATEAFRRAAPTLLRDWPGPPLVAEASLSYAAWLSRVSVAPVADR